MMEMIVEVEMRVEDVPTYFSFVTSHFSLSFDFSPLSFLLLFFVYLFIFYFIFLKAFQKTRMMMWRSFRISEERM